MRLNTRSNRASVSSFSSLEQQTQADSTNESKMKPEHDENESSNELSSGQQQTKGYCPIPQQDSIWNLSEPSIGEVHLDAANSYSLANFKRKFAKFRKSLIEFNSKRRRKNNNEEEEEEEEDEYEMAEKVAAQLINEVIRANQLQQHN